MSKINKLNLKKIVLLISVIVAVILVCILIIINNKYKKDDKEENNKVTPTTDCSYGDIDVCSWDHQKTYVIGKADGEKYMDSIDGFTSLSNTTKKLDDIVKENDDYIMDFKYYDSGWNDVKMFYDDNNYYVAYGSEGNFIFKNMYSDIGNNPIYLPTMYYMVIDDNILDIVKQELSTFFDNLTFDQNKEFYERMDDEYYSIDEENHTISVKGWCVTEKEYVDDALTIDFDNRTMTVKEYDGTTEVYK